MKTITLKFTCVMCLNTICLSAFASNVLPQGANIIYGNGKVTTVDTDMFITSKSNKNVITWDSFSVGTDNSVTFDKHSYLNIVKGKDASVIEGTVHANSPGGQFYLVNPNGITLSKSGNIEAQSIILSTSKISDDIVSSYIQTSDLNLKPHGMGKISLIGNIRASNLTLDGGQIIIRDIESISKTYANSDSPIPLGVQNKDELKIYSSTNRIDVGGRETLNLEQTYNLSKENGLIDHTGQTAISTQEEFLKIQSNLNGNYFITNDINLGEITSSLNPSASFTGSIDGAFNSISYNLKTDGSNQYIGLFSSAKDASFSNLKIENSSIDVYNPKNQSYVGGLCGKVESSQFSNIEIDKLDVSFDYLGSKEITIGALTGIALNGRTQSSMDNVISGFSLTTQNRLASYKNYIAGTVIGELVDNLNYPTSVFGNLATSNQNDIKVLPLNTIGSNKTDYTIANKTTTDTNTNFIEVNSEYHLKDFYIPFYVDSDIRIDYDSTKPTHYSYKDFVDNLYFSSSDYVNIKTDYLSDISNVGDYHHAYSSYDNGTHFYFVQDNQNLGSLVHTISVVDTTPIPTPTPNPTPVPTPTPTPIPGISNGNQGNLNSNTTMNNINNFYSLLTFYQNEIDANLRAKELKYKYPKYTSLLSIFDGSSKRKPAFTKAFLVSLNLDSQEETKAIARNTDNTQKQTNI